MSTHVLHPLFNPGRIWLLHSPDHPDLEHARAQLAEWMADGRVDCTAWTGAPVAAPTCRADVVWLLLPVQALAAALAQVGQLGCTFALISERVEDAHTLERLVELAQLHGVRVLGPGAPGLQRPGSSLNLGILGSLPPAGSVAFVTTSGALAASTLDWALDQGVGFSAVITVGAQAGIDLAEVLDFLSTDPRTESIVLHLEHVRDPRNFLSSLRAAATLKPVVVLKADRHADTPGADAAAARVATSDAGFDAAIRRAGAVRVRFFVQLFSAVKCLAWHSGSSGQRVALLSNGGGAAQLAADWALDAGLDLAWPAAAAMDPTDPWPGSADTRPIVNLGARVDPERYAAAARRMLADPAVDGVLVLFAPRLGLDPLRYAQALIDARGRLRKPLIACWLGDRSVLAARAWLAQHGIPTFRTPEPAVDAFANLAAFFRNQQVSWQTPPAYSPGSAIDEDQVRAVLHAVRAAGRSRLNALEARALLSCFHVPVVPSVHTRSAAEGSRVAQSIGFPVVLKVLAPELTHVSDVGGVMLDVRSAEQVQIAWASITEEVQRRAPGVVVDGVLVAPMVATRHGRELAVSVHRDSAFGPVIGFGAGGRAVAVQADRALELPPLNRYLAQRLIERARAARMLGPWRGAPAVDLQALEHLLLRVSELVCALPELESLDLNPIWADERGVTVLDARLRLRPLADAPSSADRRRSYAGDASYPHMAILPYPAELTNAQQLADGTHFCIRAIRPEDAATLQAFTRALSDEARYLRFGATLKELSPRQLARYTHIDYWREMALVAERVSVDGTPELLGVARYMRGVDGRSCEFALTIADAWQGRGLGTRLMQALLGVARARGFLRMEGQVLSRNHPMLGLLRRLGFELRRDPDDPGMTEVVCALQAAAGEPAAQP